MGDQAAQFELTLDTTERPDGQVGGLFSYAAELFEPATIWRLGAIIFISSSNWPNTLNASWATLIF